MTLAECFNVATPGAVNVKTLASHFNIDPPVSVADIILRIDEMLLAADVRKFRRSITTPPGTALGGWVELTVAGDGSYQFKGHMHGSGFDPYRFRIYAVLAEVGFGVVAQKSGSVGGTIGGGSRNFNWSEEGFSQPLRDSWSSVDGAAFTVSKSYEDTGLIGFAGQFAKDLLSHAGAGLVGNDRRLCGDDESLVEPAAPTDRPVLRPGDGSAPLRGLTAARYI